MGLLNKFRPAGKRKNLEEEVVEHLCDMLNTRRHYGSLHQDYGMEMYCCPNSSILKKTIAEEIKRSLEKFETRVKVIKVSPKESHDSLNLSFEVVCQIRNTKRVLVLSYAQIKRRFVAEGDLWQR